MDWSSVYEENGDESGDFNRVENVPVSARTSILDSLQVYNPYVCYAFTVNYILGVGCLGIPYAFYQSGILLGSALIIFLSFISYTTVMWIAETSHRGMQLRLDSHSKNPFRSPKLMKRKKVNVLRTAVGNAGCFDNYEKVALQHTIYESSVEANFSNYPVMKGMESDGLVRVVTDKGVHSMSNLYSSISQLKYESDTDIPSHSYGWQGPSDPMNGSAGHSGSSYLEGTTRFIGRGRSNTTDENDTEALEFSELEVTELTLDILGPKGFILFQVSLAVLTYVGLLAYTQVFIQSFTSQIWPAAPSFIPNLLFGCVVIPLSCFDLAEQITVQVLMSLLRFLSFAILIGVTGTAIFQQAADPDSAYLPMQPDGYDTLLGTNTYIGSQTNMSGVPLCDFSGFGVMFTTAIFSQIFPHIVPGLIRPLAPEDKKYVPRIFLMALVTTSVLYISIGCTCVIFFRGDIKESVNLNFIGIAERLVGTDSVYYPVISVLSMVVVLFPALDTVSVFPLIANTLGNNLTVAFPFLRRIVRSCYSYGYGDAAEHTRSSSRDDQIIDKKGVRRERNEKVKKTTVIIWRLVAATPPVICSHFITDLSTTLQFAGLCGILLALIIPALLQKYSYERIANIPVSLQFNPYSSHFSSKTYTDIVLGIAYLAFVISMVQMI